MTYSIVFSGSKDSVSALMVQPAYKQPLDGDRWLVAFVFERNLSWDAKVNLGRMIGMSNVRSMLPDIDHAPQDSEFALIYGLAFQSTEELIADEIRQSGISGTHEFIERYTEAICSMGEVADGDLIVQAIVVLAVAFSDNCYLEYKNSEVPLNIVGCASDNKLAEKFVRLTSTCATRSPAAIPDNLSKFELHKWLLTCHRHSALYPRRFTYTSNDKLTAHSKLLLDVLSDGFVRPTSKLKTNRMNLSVLADRLPPELTESAVTDLVGKVPVNTHTVPKSTARSLGGNSKEFELAAQDLAKRVNNLAIGDDTVHLTLSENALKLIDRTDLNSLDTLKIAALLSAYDQEQEVSKDNLIHALKLRSPNQS